MPAEQLSLGQGIGLQDTYRDYVPEMLQTMRAHDAYLEREAERMRQDRMAREKRKDDLADKMNNVFVDSKDLWGDYADEIKLDVADLVDYTQKKWRDNDSYNPRTDSELVKKLYNIQSQIGRYKVATKRIIDDTNLAAKTDKFDVNDKWANAIKSGKSSELKKVQEEYIAEHGLDPGLIPIDGLYTTGLIKARVTPKDFLPSLQSSAKKLVDDLSKSASINGHDIRILTSSPETIQTGWVAFKNSNPNYMQARATAIDMGSTAEEYDNMFYNAYKNSVDNIASNLPSPQKTYADKAREKYVVGEGEQDARRKTIGLGARDFTEKTITKVGGGMLPIDIYKNQNDYSIQGKPTGAILKDKKTGELFMEIAVPDPNMAKPEGWEDMSEGEKNKWYEEQYMEDPNRFQADFAPLTNNANKTKLEGTIGRNANSLFNKTTTAASDKKNQYTERQSKALDVFRKKFNREPSKAELQQILSKFK